MSGDEERLVVSLEARINEFEKRMKAAEKTGSRSFQQLRNSSSSATRAMETDMVRTTTRVNQALAQTSSRIGTFGKAFVTGLAAGAAIGALEGIRQAVIDSTKSVLEMSDQAKRAGVSFKAFQELKFVAEQNRIGIDSLTDGLKEMSLRADEFIKTGAGSAAESFRRLGYNASELARKLQDPDQLFLEIIGKLQRLDKAAQIRISDELFGGTGGEQFVQLLTKGEAGIRAQIKAANDLGIVMDDQLIAKAEEVDQQFNVIANTIGTHLKSAIVEACSAWFEFLDSYREFENQKSKTLENRQADLGMKRLDLETQILTIGDAEPMTRRKLEVQLAEIAAEERMIVEELNKRVKSVPAVVRPKGLATTSRSITPAADQVDRIAQRDAAMTQNFLTQRTAEAARSELQKDIEARAEVILAAAEKVGVSLTKAAATIQASSEIAAENATAATTASVDSATALIKQFEGFSAKPYWDVNALRAGYGSDTVTLSDNSVQRVTAGISVSVADANRDLTRRIGEFQKGIEGQIGADTFRAMTENQQAALTSIAYNYGSLPDRIVAAIKSGDAGTVSQAIGGLGSDNGGVNRGRRKQESELYLSDAPQGVQDRVADLEDRAKEYADLVTQAQAFIATQSTEATAVGMTKEAAAALRYEQELLNQAKQAGIDLNPDELTHLQALAEQMAAAEEKTRGLVQSQEDLQRTMSEFGQLGSTVAKGFVTDLINGKSAADAFKNALGQIADKLLSMALDGLFGGGAGGGGGIFGQLIGAFFGGFRAEGGPVSSGKAYVVGEKGPEIFNPGKSGTITPNDQIGAAPRSAAMPAPAAPMPQARDVSSVQSTKVDVETSLKVGVDVDSSGNLTPFVTEISEKSAQKSSAQMAKKIHKQLPESVAHINRNPRNRP
ncbi:lysozyme [Rhizobium sp. 9140]|uniref:lysozyme n=1 Tax=Rhizobium sp. 9140 TaxID=1761900 RepID=UPI0007942A42|nr:hypothetical protein [Rhizobium sp. 9140]CZT34609.1 Phage-related lysozyme (muramidase), GH24 family [Rhizobium sp. 9140]